jgi:predicted HicB family RNase H-like nuclease
MAINEMMNDPQEYGVTVRRSIEEGDVSFVASVRELPDLRIYADTHEEAYQLAVEAISGLQLAAQEEDRPFPRPEVEAADGASGRVTLRMPAHLHARLNSCAESDGVSLNHLLVTVLSYYAGCATTYFQAIPLDRERSLPDGKNQHVSTLTAAQRFSLGPAIVLDDGLARVGGVMSSGIGSTSHKVFEWQPSTVTKRPQLKVVK